MKHFDISLGLSLGPESAARDPMSGVAKDATSGIYVPANATQWTTTLSAVGISSGNPANLWLCQEASGNLADSIGAATLTAAGGGLSYQNAITGWTRKGLGTSDQAAQANWTSTSIGNLGTTSGLLIVYLSLTAAPAGERSLFGVGSSTSHRYVSSTTTPRFKAAGYGGVTAVTGTGVPGTTVHPIVQKVDRTNSAHTVYTDQEKLAPTWVSPAAAGNLLGLGDNAVLGTASARYLYAAYFSGASAEISDASVRTLLQTLGWTVAW